MVRVLRACSISIVDNFAPLYVCVSSQATLDESAATLVRCATSGQPHVSRGHVLTHAMESLPPLLVQKCLEFLPFAEVHAGVKQVSKATRKAARMALTRGRWRPFRYVSEQGLAVCAATGAGALKLDTDTFTVV